MVKTYLIDKEYLEKFLNMISMDSVHNILVTPSEKYNIICSHTKEQSEIYWYVYRVLKSEISPCDKQLHGSSAIDFGLTTKRKYVRIYDTEHLLSQETKKLLEKCFEVTIPEAAFSFINERKFALTEDV